MGPDLQAVRPSIWGPDGSIRGMQAAGQGLQVTEVVRDYAIKSLILATCNVGLGPDTQSYTTNHLPTSRHE